MSNTNNESDDWFENSMENFPLLKAVCDLGRDSLVTMTTEQKARFLSNFMNLGKDEQ